MRHRPDAHDANEAHEPHDVPASSGPLSIAALGRDASSASPAWLEAAVSISGVGTWEWDLRSGQIWADACVRELHGIPDDCEISFGRWLGAVHPDDRAELRRRSPVEVARASGALESRYRVTDGTGRTRHLISRGQVVEHDGTRPRRVVGVVVDVTASLAQADRVLETLEAMIDGYFAVDAQWRFTYVNASGERMLKRQRSELLGRALWEVYPHARGTEFEQYFLHAVRTGTTTEFEAFYPPLHGWYEIRAIPHHNGLAVYFRNIDDRRAASLARERALAAERAARHATERARARLEHMATHDPVTGLPNRVALDRHLSALLDGPEQAQVALLYCDVDRFKHVNDTLGHGSGDELLCVLAQRLQHCVRDTDLVVRMGGDEFVIVARAEDQLAAIGLASRVLAACREPIDVAGRQLVSTVSIGVAFARADTTPATLLSDADAAVYRAKQNGRDNFVLFDAELRAEASSILELETDLRRAIARGQIDVAYQPQFCLRTGKVSGVEVLARWAHPERGAVSPEEFIPVAEETGLIVPLGELVLDRVVEHFGRDTYDGLSDLTVWVNVSPRQLIEPGFAAGIARRASMIGPRLGIEVTETLFGSDPDRAERVVESISALGVKVAIDDFGTGHSCLGRLTSYPIDVIKLDQSFVSRLSSPREHAIVAACIELAHALDAHAIAEGVEEPDLVPVLQRLGCDHVSGFLFAPPIAIGELRGAITSGVVPFAAARHLGRERATCDGRIAGRYVHIAGRSHR